MYLNILKHFLFNYLDFTFSPNFTFSQVMEYDAKSKLKTFYKKYRDPTSQLFLESDLHKVYAAAKRDSDLNPVRHKDILTFQASLSTLSRLKEQRILRGRKRVLSFRKWRSYGPNNIWIGDLCFIPDIRVRTKRHTVLVLADVFSRLCFLSLQKGNSSKETANNLVKAFDFFEGIPLKFTSDRGITQSVSLSLSRSLSLSHSLALSRALAFLFSLYICL